MSETTLVPVKLVIGDRTYRVKINPKDEELVRKSVKAMNDKVIEFKTHFSGKDMQDYIAMVLIWFATHPQAKGSVNEGEITDLSQKLAKLDGMLNEALQNPTS